MSVKRSLAALIYFIIIEPQKNEEGSLYIRDAVE